MRAERRQVVKGKLARRPCDRIKDNIDQHVSLMGLAPILRNNRDQPPKAPPARLAQTVATHRIFA